MTKSDTELVQHMGGNLYRVHRSLIQYADGTLMTAKGELQFLNPRRAVGAQLAVGYDKEPMSDLREGIRTNGLQFPLTLHSPGKNFGNQQLTLLAGERRLRSIDKLVEENADCYDQEHQTYVKAKQLYEWIECRIHIGLDLKGLYKLAIQENGDREGIGEGANVALLRAFRESEWTEEEMVKVCGKSKTWLKDSLLLCDLDGECFKALCNGTINRTVALRLAAVPDLDERLKRLSLSIAKNQERIRILIEKADCSLDEARQRVQEGQAELTATAHMGGSVTAIRRVRQRVEKAQDQVRERLDAVKDLKNRKPQVTSKDFDAAAEAIDAGACKKLTEAKMEKFWIATATKIVRNAGKDAEGVDVNDAKLVLTLWEYIQHGERDIVKILRQHNLNRRH
jgi:hypothetical protein